jgi:hypothetical protein
VPLQTLSFGVRIVFQNPRFITCYDMFENFLSFSMRSRRSRHTFLRFFFCSLVRIFGTNLGQIFCMPSSKVKISWTVWRFKFNTLLLILTVKGQSDLTRSLTMVTFSSVFDMQSLPERGLSFTHSTDIQKCFMPPKNPCP